MDALLKATGDSSGVAEVVLRRAAFRGSGSDSTRAGRLRWVSQRGPIPRRHSTHRPVQPVGAARGMDTPGQAAECARLDVALVAVLSDAGL